MLHRIEAIPALKDNYIWAIICPHAASAIIVDPGEAQPVIDYLEQHQFVLSAILITHHHWDHTHGITALRKKYSAPVYGPEKDHISPCDHPLNDNDQITFPSLKLQFQILSIPGHTLGHIAYYGQNWLFCGDTLFSAGCGRLFEGTPQQLLESLLRLASLPPETEVYCGHEYTLSNLKFALKVEPDNPAIQERFLTAQKCHISHKMTLPSTIAIEKKINPFLHCADPKVQQVIESQFDTKMNNSAEVFAALRRWKDIF